MYLNVLFILIVNAFCGQKRLMKFKKSFCFNALEHEIPKAVQRILFKMFSSLNNRII